MDVDNLEDDFNESLDEEITTAEEVEKHEEKEEPVLTEEDKPMSFEDLELPEPDEDTDDELPLIVTGAQPVVNENQDTKKKEKTRTLEIPLFHRKKK